MGIHITNEQWWRSPREEFSKLDVVLEKKRSDLGLHIFLPKSRCSLKEKKSSHPFALSFPYFRPKIRVFSKKKKRFSLRIVSYHIKYLYIIVALYTLIVLFNLSIKNKYIFLLK